MKGRPGLLAVTLGSLVSAAAAAGAVASNADAPVVLLGTTEDEPLTGRIAAELRALGIGIEIRVVSGDERGIELEVESALREGARAAVRVDAQAGRTEVSVADPVTRRVALKQVLEGPPTAALAPVLAVRTVEFVRATLLGNKHRPGDRDDGNGEPGADPGDGAGDGGVTARRDAIDRPRTPLAGLGLALHSGVIATPGGLTSQFTVGLAAHIRLASRVGFEVMGFTPLTSARLDSTAQSTRASIWWMGAGLFVRQPLGARAGLELGGGVIGALLQTSGTLATNSDQVTGQTGWAKGGDVYARLGADVALSRGLALRLDLLGGSAFRQADIIVLDVDGVTRVSRPAWASTFAAALGGVEARWF